MSNTRLIMFVSSLIGIIVAGYAAAQPMHPGSGDTLATEPPVVSDQQISLNLTPSAKAILKHSMLEHLLALQEIIAALAQENFAEASAIAHQKLGFLKHHQVMQQENGTTFPRKYQELAIAHHQAAEKLSSVITARELKPILQQLNNTMKACVVCHQAYKL